MHTYASVLQQEGLFTRIVAGIPHDPASIAVYILLAASVVLIVRANKQKG